MARAKRSTASPAPSGLALPGGLEIAVVPLEQIKPHPRNPRAIDDAAIAGLAQSVSRFGLVEPIVVNRRTMRIVGGHQRARVLRESGSGEAAVMLGDWSEEDEVDLLVALNNPHAAGTFTPDLSALLRERSAAPAFKPLRLDALLKQVRRAAAVAEAQEGDDSIPEPPKKPVAKVGDLWALGDHRVACGDSTLEATWAKLTDGDEDAPRFMLTDPPYCSGGFQEAGKRQGSIGTKARQADGQRKQIANDRLSTRGFQALLGKAFGQVGASAALIFTDWRMWIPLFDVVEGSGLGVRNMVVWDKGTPGMGQGFRSQHEIIMMAVRDKVKWDPRQAVGNVIRSKRSGNAHHPTEKPVDLILQLIAVATWAPLVADPFLGSGTTLIACQRAGRRCIGAELEPAFVDVIVDRWQTATGGQARRL